MIPFQELTSLTLSDGFPQKMHSSEAISVPIILLSLVPVSSPARACCLIEEGHGIEQICVILLETKSVMSETPPDCFEPFCLEGRFGFRRRVDGIVEIHFD